jgi:NodT family efflux transporter outer membrane factor (OMF) lipoprotein
MNLLRSYLRRLTPALAAFLAVACTTVGPDYHLPSDAAVNRTEAASPFVSASDVAASHAPFTADALPDHWWRLYQNDTLDALIEKAFAANRDLRAAAANLARSRALLVEAEELRAPGIGVNAAPGYGRESAATRGLRESLPDAGFYDAGARVSYQIDLFGKISRAIEAAGADAEAAQAAYDLARVTVAADTARAYADACSSRQQMQVARRSVELQQEFVKLNERRVRAGRGSALDTSRARGQLEQLRAVLPPLEAQHRIAQYRLAVLTGEVPGVLSKDIDRCSQAPLLAHAIPVGDGAALLRRRPDIRQAERTLAGATARIGAATADLYPSISLGLSAGSTGLLSDFGAANTFRWSIGPLISWTLPATGPARSRIVQAEAASEAALARFDSVVLNALRETESALTVYARELDRNAALRASRDQSTLASQQARALYRYGRTDFLTTLDADRSLATAESALAASDAQLAANQVALFLALGGGWEAAAGQK